MSENNSIGEQPVYEHNCNTCVFLGQYEGIRDLYFHREDKNSADDQIEVGFWTVLVRHGNTTGSFQTATTDDSELPMLYDEMDNDCKYAIDLSIIKGYLLPSEVEGHPEVGGDI